MEGVASFFDKTTKEANTKIDHTEGLLKQRLRKNEYNNI